MPVRKFPKTKGLSSQAQSGIGTKANYNFVFSDDINDWIKGDAAHERDKYEKRKIKSSPFTEHELLQRTPPPSIF